MTEQPVAAGWRVFFWIAAGYNLLVGVAMFLQVPWAGPDATSAVLIFCFGIVYALVAHAPRRFAPVLVAGIVGKAMVVLMLGPPNWSTEGDPAVGAIVAGDLLFAVGFVVFLLGPARRG